MGPSFRFDAVVRLRRKAARGTIRAPLSLCGFCCKRSFRIPPPYCFSVFRAVLRRLHQMPRAAFRLSRRKRLAAVDYNPGGAICPSEPQSPVIQSQIGRARVLTRRNFRWFAKIVRTKGTQGTKGTKGTLHRRSVHTKHLTTSNIKHQTSN